MATHEPVYVDPDRASDSAVTRGHLVEYEAFIENQLRKTGSRVRGVDVAAASMILVAGTLVYFFLVGLVDHWLIAGGLGFWGRLVLLVAYLAAATWWVASEIAPLLIKQINPLYAAATIEHSQPTLKNTLLNFLLFRANPARLHARVFQAIEQQAATKLARVPVESAVDRTGLIRLGYVLVGILVVCAVYTLLSPKDLFKTVGRVAMPWADISAPTRTLIDEISPGDAQAFRGQQVTVQARVGGLPNGGKVMLYYTTADRQIVDRAVEMSLPPGDYRYAAVLPAGDSSLQQSLSYRIEAGDAVTRPYEIEVVAAPTIVVQALEYQYPEYTGLLAQRVEHQGDIKAIEGTRVTIEALANQDIQSAHVDFEGDHTLDLRMQADKQVARATFTLSLGDDRRTPEHGSYQVTFKNAAGQQNPQPVRHQIGVSRDLAPEIQFVAPAQDEIDLPADAAVDLEIVAGDPDFALAEVNVSAAKGEAKLVDESLLDEPWRGQFVKKFRIQPRKLGLAEGDVVDYWAVAVDNKTPNPNRTETSRRRIRIVSPTGRQGDQDQLAQNQRRDDGRRQPGDQAAKGGDVDHPRDQAQQPDEKSAAPNSDDRQPPDEKSPRRDDQQAGDEGQDGTNSEQGKSQDASNGSAEKRAGDGDPGASDENQGQQESEQAVPNDGTNDGEAIERILKHRDQQSQDQSDSGPSEQQGDEQQQGGEQQQDGEKPGGQQGSQDPPNQGDSKGQPGQGAAGEKNAGEKNAGQQQRQPGDASQDAAEAKDSDTDKGAAGEPSEEKQQGENGQAQQRDKGGQQKDPSSGQAKQQSGEPNGKDRGKPGQSAAPDDKNQAGDSQPGKSPQGKGAPERKSAGTQDRQSSDEQGQGEAAKQESDKGQSRDQQDVEHMRGEGTDGRNAERKGDGQPNKPDRHRQATQDNNTREDASPQDPSTKGQGAHSNDDPSRPPNEKPPQDDEQRPDARGGTGEEQKGESGAGQKTNENKGGPNKDEYTRPRRKSLQPGPDDKEQKPKDEAQSPGVSKNETDTEGQEDGETSGGGKRGGGQKANKSGTGGAGQNTAADEGAGRSDDAGDGETSDRAGGDREADGQTGQSGSKSGDGSRSKPSDGQNEKSGGPSDPQNPADSQSPPSDRNSQGPGSQGGANPSDSRPGGPSSPKVQAWKPGVDKADEANLEYTRQATDLALEHLKDQLRKDRPDQELLDRLGWSRDDLEKFVKRWESMRNVAQETSGEKGTEAQRELDEALRSLGLRPRATTLGSNAARDDRSQGYQESHRTAPPPEYIESFKAYTQGTARGGK